MKAIRSISICMLAALLGLPTQARAEDIDIYSGLDVLTGAPNMMFVIDSSANSDGTFGTCTYWDGTSPSLGNKTLGNEQCALANLVKSLETRNGAALLNLGITTSDGLYFPLTPIDDNPYTGTYIVPAGTTNRDAFIIAAKALSKHTGSVVQGDQMQETWAYYTGGDGGTTGTGLMSKTAFPGTSATTGCQKNYAIFLGTADSNSHAGDNGNGADSKAVLDTAVDNAKFAASFKNTITNGATPDKYTTASNAREWARFMRAYDANTIAAGTQGIISYSISLGGGNADMANFIKDIATFGGGKYYSALSYAELSNAILKVLNEVQAVNSVFASSSLPIAANAQGVYLNQVYMGMFRPDPSGFPRWAGNLKQYANINISGTADVQLGDSIHQGAMANTTTGFFTPNAISFWTCSNSVNPALSNLGAAEYARLTGQGQICASDPANGFWANNPDMAISAGKSYDLPDGELVEKGGAAQQIRLANLSVNYSATAGTTANPRKLYTYCPSGGVNCSTDLTVPSNAFATENTNISDTMFGAIGSVNISSLTRSGGTVTVTTATNHGFADQRTITIANATPNDYNGAFTITNISANQFSYQVTEYPPNTATQFSAAKPAGLPQTVNYDSATATWALTRTFVSRNGLDATHSVTVNLTGHGYRTGDSVTIAGARQPEYNGTFSISVTDANTFTYLIHVMEPPLVAGGGNASQTPKVSAIELYNANPNPGVSRPDPSIPKTPPAVDANGVTKVTVYTTAKHNFGSGYINLSGVTDSAGNLIPQYSGYKAVGTNDIPSSKNYFTFSLSLYPVTPAQLAGGSTSITATRQSTSVTITQITRTGSTARATFTPPNGFTGFANGDLISISGTPAIHEEAYVGSFTISNVTPNSFEFTVTTSPATPATGVGGATMTASPDTAVLVNKNTLINWVRGEDNNGDEFGPGGTVNIRPSLHGDVLHSRPAVINYGGTTIRILSTSDSGGVRTATLSADDVNLIGGVNATADIKFFNRQICNVRVASGTTIVYPSINCGDAGAQDAATTTSNVVVFYGDNGGVFHAVNGNQTNPRASTLPAPGSELWGFIPSELFSKLNRQRTNSPVLQFPHTPQNISPKPRKKDYFVDGSTGVIQWVSKVGATKKAIIYLSMRRGGRFIYALDVTTPQLPKFLWKVDEKSPGMGELGQTWSQPKIATVKGYAGPVLIFGGGYDTKEDENPPTQADTMGRGIYVLDAYTGAVVWKATKGTSDSCNNSSCTVSNMDYSIPADIALVDRDLDTNRYIDRLYAADTGGNIWRVDLEPAPGQEAPMYWRVYKLAALGCASGPCSIPLPPGERAQRKFFYPPEVIPTQNYDAVIAGTGDREHPLYTETDTTRSNMVVYLKDPYTGKSAAGMTAITRNMLSNYTECTQNSIFDAPDQLHAGYKYTLAPGEKVVTAPKVALGKVHFSTNIPTAPDANSCTSTLGVARGYTLEPFSCQAPTYIEFAGGGMPPTPIYTLVYIEGVLTSVLTGAGGGGGTSGAGAVETTRAVINVDPTRTKTYWYLEGK